MKQKLIIALGSLGFILYFLISTFVYVLPLLVLDLSFWLFLLFLFVMQFIPISSVVFWIWGLITTIQGQQDAWAIIYYALFAILFLPFFVSTITDIFRGIAARKYIDE